MNLTSLEISMYSHIVTYLDDWDTYLEYADYLQDLGALHDDLAHAYRWMGTRKKHPHHRDYYYYTSLELLSSPPDKTVPEKVSWAWYSHSMPREWAHRVKARKDAFLTRLVFTSLGPNSNQKLYPSHERAVNALAKGLKMLRVVADPNGKEEL